MFASLGKTTVVANRFIVALSGFYFVDAMICVQRSHKPFAVWKLRLFGNMRESMNIMRMIHWEWDHRLYVEWEL